VKMINRNISFKSTVGMSHLSRNSIRRTRSSSSGYVTFCKCWSDGNLKLCSYNTNEYYSSMGWDGWGILK